jgi:hypothetical protein
MGGRINKKNGQKYLEIFKVILLLDYLEARRKNFKSQRQYNTITLIPKLE